MTTTHTLRYSAQDLLAQARTDTGLDIVDSDITPALEKLVLALDKEAQLNERGAREWERILRWLLSNRLRMQRDWRAHPEIADEVIRGPLLISGTARTGSTKLQKILAASGDFQWLPCWQGLSPALLGGDRHEDPAQRIAVAAQHIDWLNAHAPSAKLIHEFSTLEPEEENLLLTHRLFGPYLNAFAFVPSYVQWYMQHHDPLDDFHFLKQCLQYLQWQGRSGDTRPWLLKAPTYPGHEALFAAVFPDAAFVTPHRDPVATVSSAMSLVNSLYTACSDADHRPWLGQGTPAYLAHGKQAQMAVKDLHPTLRWLDLPYQDITRDVEAVVETIYAFAGQPLSDTARHAMHAWEQQNTQHKHGAHRYALEDFGVTPESVRSLFGAYTTQYAAYL